MNVSKISNTSFNGLLTISGPNKKADIIVNTKAVSTISQKPFIGDKEDSLLGVGNKEGAVLTMDNGIRIRTFMPIENVVDAYKQASVKGEAKLETNYNPLMEKPLFVV